MAEAAGQSSFRGTPLLGLFGTLATLWFFLVVVLMHVTQSALNPAEQFVSEYANGSTGWLMLISFVVFGLGILAIAAGLYRSLPPGRRTTLAGVSIGIMGLGMVLAGLFAIDSPGDDGEVQSTTAGEIHVFAVLLGFLGLIAGTFLFARAARETERFANLARPAFWFGWAIVAGLLLFNVAIAVDALVGLVQRVWLAVTLLWFVLLGTRVYRNRGLWLSDGVAGD